MRAVYLTGERDSRFFIEPRAPDLCPASLERVIVIKMTCAGAH